MGVVACKLKLLEGSRIHCIFHISVLRKVKGNLTEQLILPTELVDNHPIVQPLAILAYRDL